MAGALVSGGNGFLGSHLVEKLLKECLEITVVDDLSTMEEMNLPKDVRFVKKKIENFKTEEKFDYVIHMAARPSPEDYIQNPIDTLMSNSKGTKVMLDIARLSNAVFLYTSSSEVYGEASTIPTPESYFGYVNSIGPRSCYDEGKRYSESLIMAYYRQFNLDVRIERPFNVYGPRIRADGFYGRVIPRFVTSALNDKDLIIYGDGQQTRSFLYVNDWVDATWTFLTERNLSGQFINVGSRDEITINDLAEKIVNITSSQSKIVRVEGRQDDPRRRAADITKAGELLKWKSMTSLDEGLRQTISWFKGREI
jgi:UDP-glucuronate decarboxylase